MNCVLLESLESQDLVPGPRAVMFGSAIWKAAVSSFWIGALCSSVTFQQHWRSTETTHTVSVLPKAWCKASCPPKDWCIACAQVEAMWSGGGCRHWDCWLRCSWIQCISMQHFRRQVLALHHSDQSYVWFWTRNDVKERGKEQSINCRYGAQQHALPQYFTLHFRALN